MSYNIGIQNAEVKEGKNWTTKWKRHRDDVKSAFTNEVRTQVLLLSEFGNMFESIDRELISGVTQPTGRRVHSTQKHRLRHQLREAKAMQCGQKPITEKKRKFYEDYLSGKLEKDLDECTRAHGYGKLPSTGEMLGTSGFPGLRVGFQ